MEQKFVILCCENIRPEIDAVLATGTMPRAAAESYPFHCGHVQSVWNTVRDQVERLDADGATTCLCGCGCANTFDIPKEILDSPSLVLVESGASLFLPEALAHEFQRCGAYLILPGWLMRWKQNAERDGLDRATARQMFGESLSAIVLLDTGVHPGIEPVLAEYAAFTGLAARTLPVGLDHLRFRLEALYQKWECEKETAACKTTVSAAEKRVADYSMVADLTGMIIGVHDEKTVILQVLDHFVRLCSPKTVAFLPVRDGEYGTVISIPSGAYPENPGSRPFPEPEERYQITETGDGFRIRVQYNHDLIGVLSVDGVSIPQALDEYLNLAHFIVQIAGLSLTIARTHADLMLAMKTRENEIAERIRVELALRESEGKYRTLVESSFDGIAIHQNGILVYVNQTAARLLGSEDPGVFIGKSALDMVAPEFRKRIAPRVEQAPERALELLREQFLRLDGTPIDVDVTTAPSIWEGKPAAYVTFRDITAQVRTENALRESEEQFRVIFHNQQTGLFMVDPATHTIIDANQSALSMIGAERDEVIGKVCHQYVCPAERGKCPVTDLGCTVDHSERILITRVGEHLRILKSVNPVTIRGRTYLLESFIDITERKRIEEALRQSEEKYRAIINEMQDIFYRTDPGGTITMLSPSAAKIAGYDSVDQLVGKPVSTVYANPADRDRLLSALQESGSVYAFPIDLKVRDGSIRHVTTSSHFFRDERGAIAGVEGVIHDITNLRKAEDALRESEEKFRALVETTSDFIWEVDAAGKYTYVSPQVRTLLGFDPQEMMGKTPFELMPPEEAASVGTEFNRIIASHLPITTLENLCLHKDGHTVILETSGVPRYEKDGSFAGYRGIDRDITKRKHAEEALLESEGRYRGIIENIQDVFFRTDRESRVVMTSPSATWMFGVASPAEILGKPVVSLWKRPEQRIEFLEAMKNGGGAVQDWEAEYVKSDGTAFWVSISAHLHRDQAGTYAGTEGIIRDISERKKMEVALKGALTKLNMLSSITRHDILNQITGLRTFLELSREDLKGTKHELFINKEDQAAEAIQRQIEFTKFYQDIGVNEPKWQDAGAVIKDAAGQLSFPSIELQIGISNVEIFADPLIVKVFFNLMENTLRHGERVTQISFSSAKSVEGLIIIYRDNGAGISAEDKKKLFQRGFGKHTGLGLFLSREILAITGITITENGEPGKGVQFEITVPYGAFRFTA
jgi:PAS domain S-box-containing protein